MTLSIWLKEHHYTDEHLLKTVKRLEDINEELIEDNSIKDGEIDALNEELEDALESPDIQKILYERPNAKRYLEDVYLQTNQTEIRYLINCFCEEMNIEKPLLMNGQAS